jgi:diguanylate cyclase (GGDEF)-like protein/PAS domain S-box-containing protein
VSIVTAFPPNNVEHGREGIPMKDAPSARVNRDIVEQIFNHAFEGMYSVDCDRRVQEWNVAAERISGYACEQMVHHRCFDDFLVHVNEHGEQLCKDDCPLQATIEDGQAREANVYLRHRLGHRIPVVIRTFATYNEHGSVSGAVELFRPVTSCDELSSRTAELERFAYLDRLTSLPNRRFAEDRLELLMAQFKSNGLGFSACLIDLDRFKQVNDTYGHAAGDTVLKSVADSFSNGLRSTDLVARWGGEEFLMLLGSTEVPKLRGLAERCRMLVERTMPLIDNQRVQVTASVGGAAVRPGDDLDSLLRRIDQHLYESKSKGRNRVTLETLP